MKRIVLTSKVDRNGVLHLDLPVGPADADREVRVTIEPVTSSEVSSEEWRRFVMETAGKWQGEFERPPQGEYEKREPFS